MPGNLLGHVVLASATKSVALGSSATIATFTDSDAADYPARSHEARSHEARSHDERRGPSSGPGQRPRGDGPRRTISAHPSNAREP